MYISSLVELDNQPLLVYCNPMQAAEVTDQDIARTLRSANFPALFHACGFRTISVLDTDGTERDLVEIIVILDADEWSEDVAEACRRTSLVCADAMGSLDLLSLPICRTRTEHQEAISIEKDMWRMIDRNEPC